MRSEDALIWMPPGSELTDRSTRRMTEWGMTDPSWRAPAEKSVVTPAGSIKGGDVVGDGGVRDGDAVPRCLGCERKGRDAAAAPEKPEAGE